MFKRRCICSGCLIYVISLFFFFKQKTAYEMRISDWSSDVCSSDLQLKLRLAVPRRAPSVCQEFFIHASYVCARHGCGARGYIGHARFGSGGQSAYRRSHGTIVAARGPNRPLTPGPDTDTKSVA